jgi:membrane-bound serine protease (ClpP class)
MRHLWLFAVASLVALAPAWAAEPVVRLVDFETTVNPVTVSRITKAIDEAEANGEDLVVIRLDTPGGLVVSMEKIVKRMLQAEVPVVAWVGPAGAKAASAGFFILIAADVAAMAPGTRTGAASTVMVGGENRDDDVMLKKANEDAAAMLRSIAEHRGRNIEACQEAVFAAKAYEESVALEKGLIDLVARDIDELLELLDGREIRRFDETTVVLNTAGARRVRTEFSFRQGFMEFLGHPEVAILLLMLGLLGIYVEITHPGVVFPGVVGVLSLLLFAVAAQALPISTIGILLLLLSAVMFILEIKVVSYGMLTVGGVICLVIGSVMLIDGPIPELRVPLGLVLPLSVAIGLTIAFVLRLAIKAQMTRLSTGMEGLLGALGRVTRELDPEGKIFIHGEIWNATTSSGSIPEGAEVRVLQVENLKLIVEPTEPAGRS